MKTVLVILIFFFSFIALVEIYSSQTFSDNVNVHVGYTANNAPVGTSACFGSNFDFVAWIPDTDPWPTYCINDRGDYSSQSNLFTGSPLTVALAIAAAFAVAGIAAGLLGAGTLSNICAALGIVLAVYYYANAIITTEFSDIPFVVSVFLNGIITTFFIYLFIKLLRG